MDLLQEAIGLLAASMARLEQPRPLIDLSDALTRVNRRPERQAALRAVLAPGRRMRGDRPAGTGPGRAGGLGLRPPRYAISGRDALTTSERRVADMAADRLTIREIGQVLFVSLKTVEAHLRSVYRKLDIHTRVQFRPCLEEPLVELRPRRLFPLTVEPRARHRRSS